MVSIDKAMQSMKFDVRMTEYNLNNGVVKKEELDAKLRELPDCSANVEILKLDEIHASTSEERH